MSRVSDQFRPETQLLRALSSVIEIFWERFTAKLDTINNNYDTRAINLWSNEKVIKAIVLNLRILNLFLYSTVMCWLLLDLLYSKLTQVLSYSVVGM